MEEKKTKKKKLTLSVSLKKPYDVSSYRQDKQKTSVVIEKKPQRKWGEKRFQPRESNFNKIQNRSTFTSKKPLLGKSFDIRKMAEERATKRFKSPKEENLQQKKSTLKKDKNFIPKEKVSSPYQRHL